jgi:two-component system, cell cycle sensor histidine kinase and response regulator CckA
MGLAVFESTNDKLARLVSELVDQKRLLTEEIAERRRAELAITEERRRLDDIVKGANVGTWEFDIATGETVISDHWAEMLGYTREELSPVTLQKWDELTHPDDLLASYEVLRQHFEGERDYYEYELRMRHKEGNWVWILDRGRVHTWSDDGKPLLMSGMHQDITERKRAEEALRNSEIFLSSIFEQSPNSMWVSDSQGTLIRLNQACRDLLHVTDDDVIGKYNVLRDTIVQEQGHMPLVKRVFENGEAAKFMLVYDSSRLETPKLREYVSVVLDVTISPVLDEHGRVSHAIVQHIDITERKRAEEKLLASQRMIEGIINTIPARVFWKDKSLVYLGCNAAFARDAGFTDPKDVIGKDDYQMGWRDQAELYRGDDRQVIESGCSKLLIEEPQTTPEGDTITLLTSKIPLRDSTGKTTGILGTYLDITERKRAEEALQTLFSRQEAILDAVPDIIMEVDSNKIYSWANQAGFEFFGEDVLGKEAAFYFEGDQDTYAIVQPLFDGSEGTFYVESWQRRKDGQNRLLAWWCHALKDSNGSISGALSSGRDITELKRTEEAIAQFKMIFDLANFGAVVSDLEGNITYANNYFAQVHGYAASEVLGRHVSMFHNDEQTKALIKHIDTIIREGNIAATEIGHKHADGHEFPMLQNALLLRDVHGLQTLLATTAIDITERKRMEEERLELERQLLHSQKLESLGVLAGGIAHDFNNLLTAIIGNLSIVADDLPELPSVREAVEHAMLAAEKAADLTKQILAYSGRGHITAKELYLNKLVQENAQMLRAVIPNTVTLDLQLGENLPIIVVDASQVQQVVMNLITNASEAIGDQAGTIAVLTGVDNCNETYLSRSRTVLKPEAGMFVWIEVRDTGCGMDEETLHRLFDPFFTTKFTGRGLGMSAVLGIIQGHGGAIIVDSEVGKGTMMRVLYPAVRKQEGSMSESRHATPLAKIDAELLHQSGTILIVDDDEMVRFLCDSILRRLGFQTLQAVDGEEAIRIFQDNVTEISIVILDLTMPLMDGVTAFKQILQINPNTKVILSSGYSEQDAIKGFSEQHPAGFLQKPYELETLQTEIERVLRKSETIATPTCLIPKKSKPVAPRKGCNSHSI